MHLYLGCAYMRGKGVKMWKRLREMRVLIRIQPYHTHTHTDTITHRHHNTQVTQTKDRKHVRTHTHRQVTLVAYPSYHWIVETTPFPLSDNPRCHKQKEQEIAMAETRLGHAWWKTIVKVINWHPVCCTLPFFPSPARHYARERWQSTHGWWLVAAEELTTFSHQ